MYFLSTTPIEESDFIVQYRLPALWKTQTGAPLLDYEYNNKSVPSGADYKPHEEYTPASVGGLISEEQSLYSFITICSDLDCPLCAVQRTLVCLNCYSFTN